jgi:hypothetical protein
VPPPYWAWAGTLTRHTTTRNGIVHKTLQFLAAAMF